MHEIIESSHSAGIDHHGTRKIIKKKNTLTGIAKEHPSF